MSVDKITNRIEELEMKLTFQEQTIEDLNSALIQQQSDIRLMSRMLENVASQIENINQDGDGSNIVEPPPPHY